LPEDQNNWGRIENPEFQQILKDIGFDSFYTRERGTKNLGVYEPSKIKSAIGNRGTYDTSDPDMNKAHGGVAHMKEGGNKLEAEYKELNKPAFYPRVGKIKNKNYKSPQPMPFADQDIENPELQRAMELPNVDVEVPTKENLEISRRLAQRQADLEKQIQADRSPLDKLAGVIQGGRLAGSAMFQGINSIPTRLAHGDKAAEKFIQDRIYKPTNELGVEYAGDLGQFLEELETKYKIPPIATGEVLGFAPLISSGTAQAAKAAGKGTKKFAKALAETAGDKIMTGQPLIRGVPASITNPMMKYAVKPSGKGNWVDDKLNAALKQYRERTTVGGDPAETLKEMREIWNDEVLAQFGDNVPPVVTDAFKSLEQKVALNNWIDRNLKNYIQKDMGTPSDVVRKLSDEGIVPQGRYQFYNEADPVTKKNRVEAGFPEEGLAQTDAGRSWETMSDKHIYSQPAGLMQKIAQNPDFVSNSDMRRLFKQNPWLANLSNQEIVHQLRFQTLDDLGFEHIIDTLRADLAEGRIRPEQLNKVSMDQAVRRTFDFDQEAGKQAEKAQQETMKANLSQKPHKEYESGYKWIEMPDADESPEAKKLIQDIGCQGGWCTQREINALAYGKHSEGNKLYALIDPEGRPHTQIHTQPSQSVPSQEAVNSFMKEAEERAKQLPNGYDDKDIKYIAIGLAKEAQAMLEITEIKPFSNSWDSQMVKDFTTKNPKYREELEPYLQDFVREGQWNRVGDLENTGLIPANVVKAAGWDMTGIDKKFLTKQEVEEIQSRGIGSSKPPVPPIEGEKRGGRIQHKRSGLMALTH